MESLTPHTPLIYESPDGGHTVYSRESGQDITERRLVGHKYPDPRTPDGQLLHEKIKEDALWHNIRRAAITNASLHEALERAKVIYYLIKEQNKKHGNSET